MPQSTLTLTYDDIRKRVGRDRGYRTDIEEWTAQEKEDVEFCVRDGSDLFYNHANHEWSFLSPLVTLTISDASSELDLPWDFNFLVDNWVYYDDNIGQVMQIVNDGIVLIMRQNANGTTGKPSHGAIVTESKPGTLLGQRSKIIFWPEADQAYTVKVRYQILPDALKAASPMPYGGAVHAGTILQACLAASERLDGNPMGPHNQAYAQMIETAKATDRRLKPRVLGSRQMSGGKWEPWTTEPVTYTPGA